MRHPVYAAILLKRIIFCGPPFRHGDLYDDKATAYIENDVMSFYKLSSVDRHLHYLVLSCPTGEMYLRNDPSTNLLHKRGTLQIQFNSNAEIPNC